MAIGQQVGENPQKLNFSCYALSLTEYFYLMIDSVK